MKTSFIALGLVSRPQRLVSHYFTNYYMSRCRRFPTMWYVRPAKPQISLHIWAVLSEPLLVACIFYECWATEWTSFGVSKLKMRLHRLVWVYTCQNATLLEITCRGDIIIPLFYPIVHRIGRTGRCGKTGLATTFINKAVGKLPGDSFFVAIFYIGTFFRLSVSIIWGILFQKKISKKTLPTYRHFLKF